MVALIFSLGAYANILKEHPTRWHWLLGLGIASLALCVAAACVSNAKGGAPRIVGLRKERIGADRQRKAFAAFVEAIR